MSQRKTISIIILIDKQMSKCIQNRVKINQFDNTSKYLANYIEQRKQLLLSKLSKHLLTNTKQMVTKNSYPQNKQNINNNAINAHKKQLSSLEIYTRQQSHRIINKEDHQISNKQKFITRTTLYEKQKQLKLQFEKRKHFYLTQTDNKQYPIRTNIEPIRDIQINNGIDINLQQQTYLSKHDKKKSKSKNNKQSYKDLLKESIDKYKHSHKKCISNVEQTQRWSRIQQIFSKMAFSFEEQRKTPKLNKFIVMEKQTPITVQRTYTEAKLQQKLETISIHFSPQQSKQLNKNNYNVEMHQQFDQQLSGILKDQHEREDLDTSNLIQIVVDEMNFNHQQINQHIFENHLHTPFESVSILQPQQEIKKESYNQQNIEINGEQVKIQCNPHVQQQQASSEQQEILVKHTESQLIEQPQQNNSISYTQQQVQPIEQIHQMQASTSIIIQPTVNIHHQMQSNQPSPIQKSIVEEVSHQPSLIQINQNDQSQIHVQMPDQRQQLVAQQEEQQQRKGQQLPTQQKLQQKPSLQALANIFLRPNFTIKDETDFQLPDEEETPLSMHHLQFNTLYLQKIQEILINTHNLDINQLTQNVQIDGDSDLLSQQTLQSEYNSSSPKNKYNKMSKLKDFGHFLVIHEQSQEQSRQSYK